MCQEQIGTGKLFLMYSPLLGLLRTQTAEVEKAILEHEAVKEVCVFGVPDPKFGEGIKAVCSLNSDFTLTKDELIKFCGTLIAGYKKPRYVEFIGDLPKTEDGAIDRGKVKLDYA